MRGSEAFVVHEITESQTIMLVIRFSEQGWILFTLSVPLCQDGFTESLRALLCAVDYVFKEVCVEHPEVNVSVRIPVRLSLLSQKKTFQARKSTNKELQKQVIHREIQNYLYCLIHNLK